MKNLTYSHIDGRTKCYAVTIDGMQGELRADARNSIRTYCEFIKMVYRKLLSLLGKMRSQIVGPDSLMMGHLCFT